MVVAPAGFAVYLAIAGALQGRPRYALVASLIGLSIGALGFPLLEALRWYIRRRLAGGTTEEREWIAQLLADSEAACQLLPEFRSKLPTAVTPSDAPAGRGDEPAPTREEP